MTPDESGKHTNHENSGNSNEETKVEIISTMCTSCTSENTEYKKEHISPDEKRGTNIRKSIEMRVAQEN